MMFLPLAMSAVAVAAAHRPCPDRATRIAAGTAVLEVETCGRGSTVVLIHGGNTDRRMWDREFAAWSDAYRVIRYDVRGFGRSTRPAEPYASHEDLATILDSLGIRRVVIVGLSLGGRIAVDFALTHPDRVAGMVLVGPGLSGFPWARDADPSWTAIGQAIERRDSTAAALHWLETPYMKPAMERPELRPLLRQLAVDNASSWVTKDSEQELDPPAYRRLSEIEVPTLIVVGQRDIADIQRIVAKIGSDIRGSSRVTIPGAGHMVNLERPAEFERVVRPFLDSVSLVRAR
jgi:pimeloyl-ACP methyl ester carboxylesterase